MKLITQLENLALLPQTKRGKFLTIGVFDGLHLGHQLLLEEMIEEARDTGALKVVMTFTPHPLALLAPGYSPPQIFTVQERRFFFRSYPIEYLIEVPFVASVASLSAAEFVERILVKGIGVSRLYCGEDFRFGEKAIGDITLLRQFARHWKFSMKVVPHLRKDGKKISSTWLRELIMAGQLEEAQQLLGRPFECRGRVVKGTGSGQKLGFPTANIIPPPDKLLPPFGAYVTLIVVGDQLFGAMTNVGVAPTLRRSVRPTLEASILNERVQLQQKTIRVQFLHFLRPEQKFTSAEHLKRQLHSDQERTWEYLATYRQQHFLALQNL